VPPGPCRIWFLDAFKAQHVPAVDALLLERGYIKIKIGGGTTPILCGLDTDCHAAMEKGLIDLEQIDFARQQEERPWRVPTRDRQTLVNDIGNWWVHFPHASVGVASFQRTGLSNALPALKTSADGVVEFELWAPEDDRISRLAKKFWELNNMPVERARALSVVHKDWQENRLTSFADLKGYVDDGSSGDEETWLQNQDMEMGGSDEEGDADLDDVSLSDAEAPAADTATEPPPSSAAAPAAGESAAPAGETAGSGALVPSSQTSVDLPSGAAEHTRLLMDYDRMIDIARSLHDKRTEKLLEVAKNDAFRMHRQLDPALKKELQEQQAIAVADREAMRKKLLEEDRQRKAAAAAKKRAKAAREEAKELEAVEKKRLERFRLQVDRTQTPFFIFLFLYFSISLFLYFYISIFLYFYIPIFLYFYISNYISIFLYSYISIFLYF